MVEVLEETKEFGSEKLETDANRLALGRKQEFGSEKQCAGAKRLSSKPRDTDRVDKSLVASP